MLHEVNLIERVIAPELKKAWPHETAVAMRRIIDELRRLDNILLSQNPSPDPTIHENSQVQ